MQESFYVQNWIIIFETSSPTSWDSLLSTSIYILQGHILYANCSPCYGTLCVSTFFNSEQNLSQRVNKRLGCWFNLFRYFKVWFLLYCSSIMIIQLMSRKTTDVYSNNRRKLRKTTNTWIWCWELNIKVGGIHSYHCFIKQLTTDQILSTVKFLKTVLLAVWCWTVMAPPKPHKAVPWKRYTE
jgi:hypothetical protein